MKRRIRILFSSLSAKQALYNAVLSDAKNFDQHASVLASDCDSACSASSKVDEFVYLPRLSQLSELDLASFCKQNKITHILPTRDRELPFWASRQEFLKNLGITVWVSSETYIQLCDDKLSFHKAWQKAPVSPIPTYKRLSAQISRRWVVKEKNGSGAKALGLNLSSTDAIAYSKKLESPIYQPYILGREFTAETWIDQKGKTHGVLLRWRNKVFSGESHESTVFKNEKWAKKMEGVFLFHEGAYGHCIAQVIVSSDGQLHLVEINPRLGGASPLSLHAGLSSIHWHLLENNNCLEKIPQKPVFSFGMTLIKKDGYVIFEN